MEKSDTDNHPEGAVSWFIGISRVALAVAFIKSRPSVSVRQHTESLANKFRQQDAGWKSKAQGLYEDLLHLQQELLLTRLLLKERSTTVTGNDQEIVHLLSQDDPQHIKNDCGCDTDNSTQRHIQSAEKPCSSLTPLHSQVFSFHGQKWLQDHRLLQHIQFLQCLSGLHKDHDPSLSLDDDVVWDSVVQLLDSVVEIFRQAHVEQPLVHPEMLYYAAQVVAQTLHRQQSHYSHSVQFFSKVEDLLKEMIGLLLTRHQVNEFAVQGILMECLIVLGGRCVMRHPLVQLLLSQIIHLAEHLWDICERPIEEPHRQVDWTTYENSFYLFLLLEHLAQDSNNENQELVIQELVIQLETRAVHLSNEFPLFSFYMWWIGDLFKTKQA